MGQYCSLFCDKYSTSFYLSDKSIAMIHRKSSYQKWFWLKQSCLKKGRKRFWCNILLICLLPFILYISHRIIVFRKRGKLRYFLWKNQFVWSNLFLSQKSEFDINLMEFIKTLRDFHLVSSNSYNGLNNCQVIWKEITGWFILYLIQKMSIIFVE